MQKHLVVFILMISLWLGACQASTPQPIPTATDVPVALFASPTPEEVDYCVSCHTDKEQLISTANLVEEAESESKGVG